MALSRVTIPGDGVTTTFSVSFALGYLNEDDITARVGDEVDGLGNPVYRTITFLSTELMQISGTPAGVGIPVVFERTVPDDVLLVDYEDGDIINDDNLNTMQKQALMLTHQVLDGRFSAIDDDIDLGGHIIKNSGAPIDPGDLANKAYVDATLPDAVADAQEAADAAAASAIVATSQASLATSASNTAIAQAGAASSAALLSAGYRDFARKWATEAVGVPVNDTVNPTGFSAFHWASQAAIISNGVVPVVSRAALKTVDTANVAAVAFEGSLWTLQPYVAVSALVTTDTLEGVYCRSTFDTAQVWVRSTDGKVYAKWFGMLPGNSAAANATALTAAFNFARTWTGAVHISTGDYLVGAVTITMTGNSDALHITADGYARTNLRYAGTDGISVTMIASPWWFMGDSAAGGNAVTVQGLSFVQTAATGAVGKGFAVNGQNMAGRPAPYFQAKECVFRSDKSASTWATCIELTSVSTATIETCFGYGANSDHTLGTFIRLVASVGKDASPYHVRGCETYFFGTTINAGEYIEGLHVTDCDFVGGTYGIVWNAGTGAESQLCLHGTHINVTTRALLLTGIQDSQIVGNLLWVSGNNQVVCEFRDTSNMTVTGNVMSVPGVSSACIVFGSTNWIATTWLAQASIVDGNKFANSGNGISLNTSVRNVTIGPSNVYDNVINEFNDVDGRNRCYHSDRVPVVPVIVGATVAGTGTYTTQSGWRKQCGDRMEFSVRLVWTGHTGTGGIRINGLGVVAANTQEAHAFAVYCADLTFTGVPQALIGAGSSQIILRGAVSGSAAADIAIDTSGTLVISGSYALDVGA